MVTAAKAGLLRQHLIDPEACIRCNTCEATCPIRAITHDERNYVVDVSTCNACGACVPTCPTGAIDNWRMVSAAAPYSVDEQLMWDALPGDDSLEWAEAEAEVSPDATGISRIASPRAEDPALTSSVSSATVPPWSAAHPYVHLYTAANPATARVVLNVNCTEAGFASETHHLVLDFGDQSFPVLEGQSLGILPPGLDGKGRRHKPRLYSVASGRHGERSARGHVALTVKRVLEDRDGKAVRGIASNYLCDAPVDASVQVIGPFGASFLMPNHAPAHLVMICTGTGSAPMRAMTERRRKMMKVSRDPLGKLLLFFGARTQQELPYFGPLQSLPKELIDVNLAYSRSADTPKCYVQDLLRQRSKDLAVLLEDPNTYVYICGLARMEEGVMSALADIAEEAGMDWSTLRETLKRQGRLQVEIY